MPNQLPSGRWRARVVHPRTGKQINPAEVIGGPTTHEDEERRASSPSARPTSCCASPRAPGSPSPSGGPTGRPTRSGYGRPSPRTSTTASAPRSSSPSTATKPIRAIDDEIVAAWLRGGSNRSTIPALRAMFNDASSAAAGRLVTVNPFANLRLPSSRGRKDVMPPDQAVLATCSRSRAN